MCRVIENVRKTVIFCVEVNKGSGFQCTKIFRSFIFRVRRSHLYHIIK